MWKVTSPTVQDAFSIAQLHADLLKANRDGGKIYQAWLQNRVAFRRSPANINAIACSIEDGITFWQIAKTTDKQELIGFITGTFTEDSQLLDSIYVAQAFHGSTVARALIHTLFAKADSARAVKVIVAPDNARARSFYRKHGFQEVENSLHYFDNMQELIAMARPPQAG